MIVPRRTLDPRDRERSDRAVCPQTPTSKDVRRHVGREIETARQRLGMSQKQLADAVGISARAIDSIERGESRPDGPTLFDIAHVLGVEVLEFFRTLYPP